jgi:glycosyltransferase involved in cell wall biosynthesis
VRLVRGADLVHLVGGPSLGALATSVGLGKPTLVHHHTYQAACPNGLLLYGPLRERCPGWFQQGRYDKCMACAVGTDGLARRAQQLAAAGPRRALLGRVDRNLPVTDHVLGRLALPRSQVMYPGVPDAPVVRLGATARPFTAAYVGRLVAEKGLPVLVDAAAMLTRTVEVIVVGDGPERGALEARARQAGAENVHFLGVKRGPALEEALAGVSALVIPSVWEETACLAALEQMVRGRALVVSDIGGLAEVVGDAGLKFPPGDAPALAAALRRLAHHPDEVGTLGERGRARAERLFLTERLTLDHLALYAQVAGERRRARGRLPPPA